MIQTKTLKTTARSIISRSSSKFIISYIFSLSSQRIGFFILKHYNSDTSHYENVPFEVPEGWAWCRLEDIAYVAAGSTPSKESFVENGVPYIKMYNLRNQKIDFEFHPQYITEEVHNNKLARSRTQPGDLLMNIVGPPLGKLAIIPESLPKANFNQAAVLIRPFKFKPAITQYLLYYLSELSEINSISTKGSAGQVNISLTQSQQMRIALPPLAELERITQKIESLFSKIGVLETSIDNIYDHISKIKSGILEKALSGKLVSQDKTDEPAITLLKSINPDFEPTDNRHYRQLPDSWEICQLKDIFDITMGQSPAGNTINGKCGTEFHQGKINFTEKYLSESSQYTTTPSKTAAPESLLLCVRAPVGVVNITKREICIGRGLCSLRPKYDIDCLYWLYILSTLKDYFEENATGSTFKAISGDIIRNACIPFPPLSEQKRILSKINELFCLLDKITAEL